MPTMVMTVLKEAKTGLRPVQVAEAVRGKYGWQDMPGSRVNNAMLGLKPAGKVQKYGERYRLLNGQ
jgi:hypothetical protein